MEEMFACYKCSYIYSNIKIFYENYFNKHTIKTIKQ